LGPSVLIVGGGAREHALARALTRSPERPRLHAAPGNPGIGQLAERHDVPVADVPGQVALARRVGADLVVIGPEAPLVAGLADALAEAGIACFGPSAAAAALEGSKAFCKEVMAAAGVPTAAHTVVRTVETGMDAIGGRYPAVIKADGLAAGKGVVIATDAEQARSALEDFLVHGRFGTTRVVIEEHLAGQECSLFALCDGQRAVPLASAQDFKRIHDGDEGPNTGGMGSYSPMPAIGPAAAAAICAEVHQPVVTEMRRRGTPFRGLLYAGLMLGDGGPKVIEFNARFGDPETQAILPRLRSDLLALLRAAAVDGGLAGVTLEWDPRPAVTVVLASAGYPVASAPPELIGDLPDLGEDVIVTHAGTALDAQGRLVTAGGRVLSVTALGEDLAAARSSAYAAAEMISFRGRQMRRDIAAGVTACTSPS
jgi:phosphoribosylamine--glycine ligase